MADNENKIAPASDVEETATDEKGAAAKVAKAAKGNKKKSDKPSGARSGKIKKFFKDFRGEVKKIVWPDAKMVLKSTGVVLLVVAILSIIIYGIDQGLSAGITGLKKLATNDTSVSETVDEETGEEKDAEADADAEAEAEDEADAEEEAEADAEADVEADAAEETPAD
ncbi:MAG: preprotein translocase subunit SecE [Clostridia bacterium]|nr:preprotein translocase subunit SecE [Clostridia bacterium]